VRLRALDTGHRGRARAVVWFVDTLSGRAPDVLRLLMYRPSFFGRPAARAFQQVMRGPSPWSVTERELFAGYTSRLNQCPF
jgi:hypothetical protein